MHHSLLLYVLVLVCLYIMSALLGRQLGMLWLQRHPQINSPQLRRWSDRLMTRSALLKRLLLLSLCLVFLTLLMCSCATRPPLTVPAQCLPLEPPAAQFMSPPKVQSSIRATLAPNSTKSAETPTSK